MKLPVLRTITGLVIYDGPSLYDGESIIAIATGLGNARRKNPKTGPVVSTWIMRKDMPPHEAAQEGLDASVCGTCKHRYFGSCYVNLGQGPYQVWQTWKAGGYHKATPSRLELLRDQMIRFGAYGDPAYIPLSIWDSVCSVAAGWFGYTHAWRQRQFQGLKRYCMASADTWAEAQDAISRDWRPFYVRSLGDPMPEKFFSCPASEEAGKRMTCQECGVCKGGSHQAGKGLPSIIRHGPSWKKVFFDRGIRLLQNKKAYKNTVRAA
jgi:hypothetical protein